MSLHSAALMLHLSRTREMAKININQARSYQLKFQPTLTFLADISMYFTSRHAPEEIETASPFVAHSLSLAIKAQHDLDRELGRGPNVAVLAPLEDLVGRLSKRWAGTEAYISNE